MYKIEKKEFGFKLTFGDFISADEMKKWVKESESILEKAPITFGIFVDMRTLKPLLPDAQLYMQQGQKFYRLKGMVRSVVILEDSILTMQFKRIARETGINKWERYIDASKNNKWEEDGLKWLKDGIDPEV